MKTKDGVIKQKSDHNTLLSQLKFGWKKRNISNRMEMYNLKNRENQKGFKESTRTL